MNPINSAKLPGLLLLSFLISACGGDPDETILTPGETTTDVLSIAHNTWKANGYSNYTFEFQGDYEQPAPIRPVPWVTITVENNRVVKAVEIEGGKMAWGPWDGYEYGFFTIDRLFTWLENHSQDSNMAVEAVYDAASGFPVEGFVYRRDAVNSGLRFSIRKVTVR